MTTEMTTWTDKAGITHILLRNGDHYVLRGVNYQKIN